MKFASAKLMRLRILLRTAVGAERERIEAEIARLESEHAQTVWAYVPKSDR